MTDEFWTTVWTSASIAAVISLVGSLITLWVGGRRDRQNRHRQTFARALAAAIDYREFPYVIRRRRADQLAAERSRITEELRHLQSQLNYFTAWIDVESPAVAQVYRRLVAETRRVVGPMIRTAWTEPPIAADDQVSIAGLDFAKLDEPEMLFIEAVRRHFSWLKWLQ